MSIPCGLSRRACRSGFQLIGPAFSENRLLAAAHALERALRRSIRARRRGWRVPHERAAEGWEAVIGLEIHVQLSTRTQDVLPLPERVRRRAEHAHLPGLHRAPGRAAGAEPRGGRDADRASAWRSTREIARALDLPPQELLLSRLAQGVPDQPVRRAALHRRPLARADGRRRRRRRLRCARTWRRTPPRRVHAGGDGGRIAGSHGVRRRLQPLRHAAAWRSSPSPTCARPSRRAGSSPCCMTTIETIGVVGLRHGEGLAALRRQRQPAPRPARPSCGTKTELKNMNSFRYLERGIDAELRRQTELLRGAASTSSTETLHYDPARGRADARCARRSRRTTTATSPSPTSCRSRLGRADRARCAPRCRSCRPRACAASSATTACSLAQALDARPRPARSRPTSSRSRRPAATRGRRPTGCSTSSRRTSTRPASSPPTRPSGRPRWRRWSASSATARSARRARSRSSRRSSRARAAAPGRDRGGARPRADRRHRRARGAWSPRSSPPTRRRPSSSAPASRP